MVRAVWSDDVSIKTIQDAWNKTKIITGPDNKEDMENSDGASAVSDDLNSLNWRRQLLSSLLRKQILRDWWHHRAMITMRR